MYTELQHLVDSLATELSRPAIVEDRRQRLVVYSRHSEPDRRGAPRLHSAALRVRRGHGMAAAVRAGQGTATRCALPSNPSLGMLPRVCVPIRHHDLLLGYLWFIDEEESMSAEQIALAETAAQGFALALYREVLAGELASSRETEAIRNLLLSESDAQALRGAHSHRRRPLRPFPGRRRAGRPVRR